MTAASRILVCGSRQWPWPDTVTAVLDRAADRHGDDLVIIESATTGAARAGHRWCLDHDLPAWRHCCYSATGAARSRARTRHWSDTERHQRMITDEGPRLVIAFHEHLRRPGNGSTAALCRSALAVGLPVWLVPTADPGRGMWLSPAPAQPETHQGHSPACRNTHAATATEAARPGPHQAAGAATEETSCPT
ncbi:SLOG family protein [Streptomyces syringium]|uniref:SLOG family protein n=1 Tax=Streptomyces syringium TaxID=76729 RepID=UPI00343CBB3F